MSDLPRGWVLIPLGQVGTWKGGGTPSKRVAGFWVDGSVPWASPKDMKRFRLRDTEEYITEAAVASSATNVVGPGSVLVVTRSGILRRTVPVAVNDVPMALNQDLKALTPHPGVVPEYIAWCLRALEQQILDTCTKDGTTVDSIDFGQLQALTIPVAPTAEQQRIVAAIEEEFSRIDAGVAALGSSLARMEALWVSTLDATFRFDEDTATELGSEIFSFVTSGSRGWAKYYSEAGALFLRVGNVKRDDIVIDSSDVQHVSPPASVEGFRTLVAASDLLITITADIGRVAVVPPDIGQAFVNQHVAIARPRPRYNPHYLAWFVASRSGQRQLMSLQRGVTKTGLGLNDIRALRIPIPSRQKQDGIAAELVQRKAALQRLRGECIKQRQRADSLRSAVLAAAFCGRLVRQDPNNQPASDLLEHIAGQRSPSSGNEMGATGRSRAKVSA